MRPPTKRPPKHRNRYGPNRSTTDNDTTNLISTALFTPKNVNNGRAQWDQCIFLTSQLVAAHNQLLQPHETAQGLRNRAYNTRKGPRRQRCRSPEQLSSAEIGGNSVSIIHQTRYFHNGTVQYASQAAGVVQYDTNKNIKCQIFSHRPVAGGAMKKPTYSIKKHPASLHVFGRALLTTTLVHQAPRPQHRQEKQAHLNQLGCVGYFLVENFHAATIDIS